MRTACDAPTADESQCSDTEVDHALNGKCRPGRPCRSHTNDTYTITSETADDPDPDNDMTLDGTSKCLSSTAPLGNGEEGEEEEGTQTPLSDAELDRVFDGDDYTGPPGGGYVEFPCIEYSEAASFSSYVSSSRSEPLPEADRHGNEEARAPVAAHDSTSPSSDPGIADMNTKRCYGSDRHSDDLSSPDSDVEEELEAAFACGGPLVSHMISSISETELDLSSDSSSGRSSHLTNSIEEASSPTSDPELDAELDPELDAEQDSGIVGLKASLLLGQPDPIKREAEEDDTLDLDDGQTLMGLQSVDDDEDEEAEDDDGYEHQADPDETLPPALPCEDSGLEQLLLKVEPDHGLESFKRSFYLPVGPRLMPCANDYDPNSEGESESESEDELSENSDSPWLLSNLVNKMMSEGSYPISCPEECLKRSASISDTISPSTPADLDTDGFAELDVRRAGQREAEQPGVEGEGRGDSPAAASASCGGGVWERRRLRRKGKK